MKAFRCVTFVYEGGVGVSNNCFSRFYLAHAVPIISYELLGNSLIIITPVQQI